MMKDTFSCVQLLYPTSSRGLIPAEIVAVSLGSFNASVTNANQVSLASIDVSIIARLAKRTNESVQDSNHALDADLLYR